MRRLNVVVGVLGRCCCCCSCCDVSQTLHDDDGRAHLSAFHHTVPRCTAASRRRSGAQRCSLTGRQHSADRLSAPRSHESLVVGSRGHPPAGKQPDTDTLRAKSPPSDGGDPRATAAAEVTSIVITCVCGAARPLLLLQLS